MWRRTVYGYRAIAAAAAAGCCSLVSYNASTLAESPPSSALDPKEWRSFTLKQRTQLTHNTALYRFALDNPSQVVGLPVASCLLTRAPLGTKDDGSPSFAIRPYTPVSPPDARGYFDLIVKVYPDGKMTQHLHRLQVGDSLDVKGPIVKLPYTPNMKKVIGMVAGGTGITPMLQVIEEVLRNPNDTTELRLLFANVSVGDIICKDRIDALVKQHPKRLKVHYVVDKAPSSSWRGGVGYVTSAMLKEHMPPPGNDVFVFVCGPPGLMNAVSGDKAKDKSQGELTGMLKQLGYTSDMVFKF